MGRTDGALAGLKPPGPQRSLRAKEAPAAARPGRVRAGCPDLKTSPNRGVIAMPGIARQHQMHGVRPVLQAPGGHRVVLGAETAPD